MGGTLVLGSHASGPAVQSAPPAEPTAAPVGEIAVPTLVVQPDADAAVRTTADGAPTDPETVAAVSADTDETRLAQEEPAAAPPIAASPAAAPVEAPVQPLPETAAGRWQAEGVVFVEAGQEWSPADLATLDTALSALPAHVRHQLGNPQLGPLFVHVNRQGRTQSGSQPYGGPANFFSTNENRNELVLFPGQSLITVLHELGHAYNLRRVAAASYAHVFLDPEMQGFMAAVGWRVLTPAEQIATVRDHAQVSLAYAGAPVWTRLSRNDALEDFANSFALYYADPQALLTLSPERFAWFELNLGR